MYNLIWIDGWSLVELTTVLSLDLDLNGQGCVEIVAENGVPLCSNLF